MCIYIYINNTRYTSKAKNNSKQLKEKLLKNTFKTAAQHLQHSQILAATVNNENPEELKPKKSIERATQNEKNKRTGKTESKEHQTNQTKWKQKPILNTQKEEKRL